MVSDLAYYQACEEIERLESQRNQLCEALAEILEDGIFEDWRRDDPALGARPRRPQGDGGGVIMEWISVEDQLPKNRTYVLIYLNVDNWHDEDHQSGLNYRVAKFVRGLSKEKRERMTRGEIEDRVVGYGTKRSRVLHAADEEGNNERPYIWSEFGPHTYNGQEVTHWMPLPEHPS